MKRDHSVFITINEEEIKKILHEGFKKRGWLKDIPKYAEYDFFDGIDELSIEYKWEET